MIGGVDRKVNTTERNRVGLEKINYKNSMSHVCSVLLHILLRNPLNKLHISQDYKKERVKPVNCLPPVDIWHNARCSCCVSSSGRRLSGVSLWSAFSAVCD